MADDSRGQHLHPAGRQPVVIGHRYPEVFTVDRKNRIDTVLDLELFSALLPAQPGWFLPLLWGLKNADPPGLLQSPYPYYQNFIALANTLMVEQEELPYSKRILAMRKSLPCARYQSQQDLLY